VLPASLLRPSDFTYLGAFRLPEATSTEGVWEWGGLALAYYPKGDPAGAADGFPGSLFGVGSGAYGWVSEISIPAPRVSAGKSPTDLPVATTLQPFQDIRGTLIRQPLASEVRVGLEYLPAQGQQASDKLYFAWGEHFEEERPSHMWCELDLASPRSAGLWWVGNQTIYAVNDYLLAIPEGWAAAHTPGKLLATGRFRDGGWSGQGPSLFAIGPWNDGNPPPDGSHLAATPLLHYSSTLDDPAPYTMNGYHHSDEWSGAAWLSAGGKAAVVFIGTKGTGNCWYGTPEIECHQNCGPLQGWWSTGFVGQMIFYNPDDLAAVAQGRMQPYEPQPYATLDLDDRLFYVRGPQQKTHLRAATFDRDHGLLYLFEPGVDPGVDQYGDRTIVHVWKIQ
jgi:hypothetical protein